MLLAKTKAAKINGSMFRLFKFQDLSLLALNIDTLVRVDIVL